MADLKDSGHRREFSSGAVRDRGAGKARPVLIPAWAEFAYGWILEAGARKYNDRNWEKGMPMGEYIDSARRHLDAYKMGKRDEAHLWQALWNVGAAIHTQVLVYLGIYPKEFYDLPNHITGPEQAPIMSEFEIERVNSLVQPEKKSS